MPVILVDFTVLSDGAIHNKNDKAGVNDPDAKRAMLKKLETQFNTCTARPTCATVQPPVPRAGFPTHADAVTAWLDPLSIGGLTCVGRGGARHTGESVKWNKV